jgi:hypothetical protein
MYPSPIPSMNGGNAGTFLPFGKKIFQSNTGASMLTQNIV